ncbi:hypothetical protein JYK14_23835 [Siccirubricoccus sp. KC 17139]|uniref:Uncharacterized protein n=1 Tax=Siccirubricoccus soli TaxID=2899147 RepID=A0ABT1DB57_9PROT|nr:hypothetical protein [Siccirubricoccus soli]MCO6419168.1 hypothetical protein [Siccirubricoccus soli]MCP2685303.1 hypothetical protein [Siccirubricoccus soli]
MSPARNGVAPPPHLAAMAAADALDGRRPCGDRELPVVGPRWRAEVAAGARA